MCAVLTGRDSLQVPPDVAQAPQSRPRPRHRRAILGPPSVTSVTPAAAASASFLRIPAAFRTDQHDGVGRTLPFEARDDQRTLRVPATRLDEHQPVSARSSIRRSVAELPRVVAPAARRRARTA